MINSNKETCKIANKDGTLGIHYAAAFVDDSVVTKALIDAFPEGLMIKDNAGKIPIMYGAEKKLSLESISSMLSQCPESARVKDEDGRLALHYSVFKRTSHEEGARVEARYRGNCKWIPGTISRARLEGTFDIDYDNGKSEPKVRFEFIRALDPSLTVANPSHGDSEMLKIMNLIYYCNKEAAGTPDDNGRYPLHYAVKFDAPVEVVRALVSYHPDAVHTPDGFDYLPIQLAEGYQPEVVQFLLPLCMFRLGFAWVWAVTRPDDQYVEQVEHVLDQLSNDEYETRVHQLANLVDPKGCRSVDAATPLCRDAIQKRLYFHRRYEILNPTPEYTSDTKMVLLARDHGPQECREVALKFCRDRCHHEKEVEVREKYHLSDDFVIPLLVCYGAEDADFMREVERKITPKYKRMFGYLLVMPAADKNLSTILKQERHYFRNGLEYKVLFDQIVRCLIHLHERGLVHGDLKPAKIMRMNGSAKLIDLDTALDFRKGELVTAVSARSTAFMPPELLVIDDERKTAYVRGAWGDCPDDRDERNKEVTAHPAQDMWSLGVVLFHLCSGEALFHANDEDMLDDHRLFRLALWTDEYKSSCLDKVEDPLARNLISQLLHKNPEKRPTAQRVLDHPFLSGKTVFRMVGQSPEYDVFLSYRVATESIIAERLYDSLVAKGLKVWWDKKCLDPGVPWEEGFCNGLANCHVFVPLISSAVISQWSRLQPDSPVDNVLLENVLALELKRFSFIDRIFPVLIGGLNKVTGQYDSFPFLPLSDALVEVSAVTLKMKEHLDRLSLGDPMGKCFLAESIRTEVLKYQGHLVEGNIDDSLAIAASTIHVMFSESATNVSGDPVHQSKRQCVRKSVSRSNKDDRGNDNRGVNAEKGVDIKKVREHFASLRETLKKVHNVKL